MSRHPLRETIANLLQSLLERLGYFVYRHREATNLDVVAEFHRWSDPARYETVATRYTYRPPYPWKTYSPWFDSDFRSVYDQVRGWTLLPEDRCYYISKLAEYCAHLGGTMAECGVYRGGSAYLIARALAASKVGDPHLHLFDTFTGMPAEQVSTHDSHKPGQFSEVSAADVRSALADFPFVELHPGTIPESLSSIGDDTWFSFVHLDVDLYRTNKSCCEFFYDRMMRGGALLFDEYGFEEYELTERRAVDDFFAEKAEQPLVIPTGQCVVFKV
jgi:O-methyltransferase